MRKMSQNINFMEACRNSEYLLSDFLFQGLQDLFPPGPETG